MSVTTLNRTIYGIALLALSGCAAPPPAPPKSAATASAAQDTNSPGPIALAPPPTSSTAKSAPVRKLTDRKAVATAPAPAPPVRLVGMDEGAVQALLGSPVAIEDHAPGKTLRYRKNGCVLSVALYPDVQTRVFRTLSYEVTSDEHNAGAKQLCETKFGNVTAAD